MSHSISFGICTSNDINHIEGLLKSILEISKQINSVNHSFKIIDCIIVSSGSIDGTNQVINEYSQNSSDVPIIPIIERRRNGKSDAINKIIQMTKSDYGIFLPADVQVTYHSIVYLILKILESNQIGIVCGRPIPNEPTRNHNSTSKQNISLKFALNSIWELHHQTLLKMTSFGLNSHSSGELMILQLTKILQLPEEIINDDAYLGLHYSKNGFIVEYEPRARVLIDLPKTKYDYLVQRTRIVQGHRQLSNVFTKNSTNFRNVFFRYPLLGLLILFTKFNDVKFIFGFISAFVLESSLELRSRVNGNNGQQHDQETTPIWKRIGQPTVELN